MKKLVILLFTLASLSTTAMAQTTIDNVWRQITNESIGKLTDANVSSGVDETGKQWKYEYYSLLLKKNSSAFNKIADAFKTDRHEAYDIFRKQANKDGDKDYTETIAYGKELARLITFGTKLNHNYEVLLFHDKSDNTFRTAYGIVWFDEGDNTRCQCYRIYGKDPRQDKLDTNRNVTYGSDGSIIIYDGNTNNSTVLRNQSERIELGDNDILDATDFMVAFNKIVASIKSMQSIAKDMKYNGDLIGNGMTEHVNNMLILCKRHSKLLGTAERNACAASIDDIIKNATDTNTTEMLKLAKSYLGK